MDKAESRFKSFVHQMSKMILNLLSSLDVSKFAHQPCYKINILVFYYLLAIDLLDFNAHIATNTSHSSCLLPWASFIFLQITVHFHKGCFFRVEPNIEENSELRSQFSTESIQKPIMRRQFPSVFVFDTHKKIHHSVFLALLRLIRINSLSAFSLTIALYENILAKRDFFTKTGQVCKIITSRNVVLTIFFTILKGPHN